MSDNDPSASDPFGPIADEFVAAFRHGKRPSVEEYARRYPEQAAAIDPRDPLPRWGIALALGPRTNDPDIMSRMKRAFTEAQAAIALSRDHTGLARDLSSALAARYTQATVFDAGTLNRAYVKAMSVLAAKYPTDELLHPFHRRDDQSRTRVAKRAPARDPRP